MKITDRFSLPYPDDDDFGNGALDLQYFAESVETQLVALQTGLQSSLYTQGFITQSTADVTGIASGGEQTPFGRSSGNFWNGGTPTAVWNTTGAGTTLTINETGSYIFGAYVNLIAAGTVNVNTLRLLTLGASVPAGAQFTNQKQYLYRETTLEPNAAGNGVFMCVQGMFDYQMINSSKPGADINNGYWLGIAHGNTSSTLTLKAGARFWSIKVADIVS